MKFYAYIKNSLIFISLLSMLYVFYLHNKNGRESQATDKPQEYMSTFKVTKYNLLGNVQESLSAEYWEFMPHKGCSDIKNPRLMVFKDNGDVWNLVASKALAWHATVTSKISKIDLIDGVEMRRLPINNAVPLVLETTAVEYLPEDEQVSTTEFVSMEQPGLKVSGYGMLGYLERGWIKLNERITTIYTPKNK